MSAVASKNPYDLLGDDGGEGGAAPQTAKPAVKTEPLSTRRTEPSRGNDRSSRGGGPRRGDDSRRGGNDSPRGGRTQNDNFRSERFTERGGKGGGRDRGRPGRPRDDRHSKTGVVDTEKAVGQGWGANTGPSEWTDEQAGENIAKADEKVAAREDAHDGAVAGEEAEPEEKVTSYADYLAQQAQAKLNLTAAEGRKANEGVKENKSWAKTELQREEEEEYFVGEQKRQKERKAPKEKQVVEIDQRYVEPQRTGGERGGRGGRGGGRGGFDRERGDGHRGGRGEGRGGAPRGEHRGGDHRGGRGGGGAPRGGAGRGGSAPVNVSDEKAFPTLGS